MAKGSGLLMGFGAWGLRFLYMVSGVGAGFGDLGAVAEFQAFTTFQNKV